MNIKRKICILIIVFVLLSNARVIAGYINKITLKVTGEIAKPIFIVNYDEEIKGNYSDISNFPEYNFEIKNYNDENEVSQIDFNVEIEVINEGIIEFELINVSTNETILNNSKKIANIILEKNNPTLNKYKLIINSDKTIIKEKVKIYIDAKYYKYELKCFEINVDKRELEYEIYNSVAEKKYSNNDVVLKIKCNKPIKAVNGFEISENNTCLSKVYAENCEENIIIEDFWENKKNIKIIVSNIDKSLPEIIGIEEGKSYSTGLKLVYKDNIGIKNIKIEKKLKNNLTIFLLMKKNQF